MSALVINGGTMSTLPAKIENFYTYSYSLRVPWRESKGAKELLSKFCARYQEYGFKLELINCTIHPNVPTPDVFAEKDSAVTWGYFINAHFRTTTPVVSMENDLPDTPQGLTLRVSRLYRLTDLGFVSNDANVSFEAKTATSAVVSELAGKRPPCDAIVPPVLYVTDGAPDLTGSPSFADVVRVSTRDPFCGLDTYSALRGLLASREVASLDLSVALRRVLAPPRGNGIRVVAYHIWPLSIAEPYGVADGYPKALRIDSGVDFADLFVQKFDPCYDLDGQAGPFSYLWCKNGKRPRVSMTWDVVPACKPFRNLLLGAEAAGPIVLIPVAQRLFV